MSSEKEFIQKSLKFTKLENELITEAHTELKVSFSDFAKMKMYSHKTLLFAYEQAIRQIVKDKILDNIYAKDGHQFKLKDVLPYNWGIMSKYEKKMLSDYIVKLIENEEINLIYVDVENSKYPTFETALGPYFNI